MLGEGKTEICQHLPDVEVRRQRSVNESMSCQKEKEEREHESLV